MKTLKFALLVAAAAGIVVVAEEYPEYITWMKVNGSAMGTLGKMEKKTGRQAVRSAEAMGSVYENMIGFWRQRNANDAVKWSEAGKAAALELATAASSENEEKAAAAFSALNDTCKSCHEAHREKLEDGKFRIR